MKFLQRSTSLLGASALAAGLVLGTAGVASATTVDITVELTNVNGTLVTGSNSAGPKSVTANLDFTIPQGQIGPDAVALTSTSNPVDFSTEITGDLNASLPPSLDIQNPRLTAQNTFGSGLALADFLLGNTGYVDFEAATLQAVVGGSPTPVPLANPVAQIKNPVFSDGAPHSLKTLLGGTLSLKADQSLLASLNLEAGFTNGSGTFKAIGQVETGPVAAVPAPSGLAMLLFMGMALGGIGFALQLKGKGRKGSMPTA